jgi:fructoselysine 6-phosphate deglycase
MTDKPFPTEAQIAAALAAAKARPELTEIYFVACGGSYALMLPNQYAVDRHAKTIAGHALNAAEFLARNPARLGPSSAVILCSHSGTTPETVEAARFARSKGALTIALTNLPGSPLDQAVEFPVYYTHAPKTFRARPFRRRHGPADLRHHGRARRQPSGAEGREGVDRPSGSNRHRHRRPY